MMRANMVEIHCIADCLDCDWHCEDYLIAKENARNHAKEKHHKVIVEDGREGCYDGRQSIDGVEGKQ
jgi:hypothetical protein